MNTWALKKKHAKSTALINKQKWFSEFATEYELPQ